MIFRMILFILICCACNNKALDTKPAEILSNENYPTTICFGSCSEEDDDQPLWDDIIKEQADVWIWLGDNIYGDTKNMKVLAAKYAKQKSHPTYQKLIASTTILGTWDDHDYGENNAGKHYTMKAESQQELLNFLDVPKDDMRRKREGVYSSYSLQEDGKEIKIILLDTRYFRDDPIVENGAHVPKENATILGEEQWQWLEDELKNSNADIHIIGSGIQVIAAQHRFEKWANFPDDLTKLYDMLESLEVKQPIFISGDRHIGEFSKINHKGQTYYDITSSSLTHGWRNRKPEQNDNRIGNIVYDLNYGCIYVSADGMITGKLKGDNGEKWEAHKLSF